MNRKQMIEAARGSETHTVSDFGSGLVSVRRRGRGAVVVNLYPDGTILRGDVRLDLARPMRVHEAAKALGLG